MMADFEIGTTSSTTNINALSVPLPEPKSSYLPYSRTVMLGSGAMRGVGAAWATWTFAVLTIEQYNQLRTFCPGSSAEIYIRTKIDDDTYGDFQCTMIVPNDPQDRFYAHRKNYTVQFRNLVLIEGS
jgi:hypothetical protein